MRLLSGELGWGPRERRYTDLYNISEIREREDSGNDKTYGGIGKKSQGRIRQLSTPDIV